MTDILLRLTAKVVALLIVIVCLVGFASAQPKRNRFESCALELLSFYTNSCYKIERLDFASTRLRNRFPLLPR